MELVHPDVSVIVVNWNGRAHLWRCLPSLVAQTYPAGRVQIIVVDNGSSDGSVAFLEGRFPAVEIVRNAHNAGFAAANNQAAAIARGPYLALVNNDMVADPGWLAALVDTATRTGAACVAGTILSHDGTHIDFARGGLDPYGYGWQAGYGEPVSERARYADETPTLFACGGSMLVRRDVYLDAGGLDPRFFAYFEDVDFGWRLHVLGHAVVTCPAAITYHRHHGTSRRFARTRRMFHIERNSLAMVYTNYDDANYLRWTAGTLLLRFARLLQAADVDPGSFAFDAPSRGRLRRARDRVLLAGRVARRVDRIVVQFAAVADFVRNLPAWREKRARVQSRRTRPDSEIVSRMEPKGPYFTRPRYEALLGDDFRDLQL